MAKRQDPFYIQVFIDQGNLAYDYTWYLDGKLLSESDKQYFKGLMEKNVDAPFVDLQIDLLNNLETTNKKMIWVYGEDDPWTGAAIPDSVNPNVKKYIVPHGTHTDDFTRYAWYEGGAEIVQQIMDDVMDILNQ